MFLLLKRKDKTLRNGFLQVVDTCFSREKVLSGKVFDNVLV